MDTYSALADSMAKHPALQIFRRYSALNVKSILYYEAELAYLESFLKTVEGRDHQSSNLLRDKFGDRWCALAFGAAGTNEFEAMSEDDRSNAEAIEDSAGDQEDGAARQWKLMCRIRTVLDAYCTEQISCPRIKG